MAFIGNTLSQKPAKDSAPVKQLTEVPQDIPSELKGVMSDQIMRRYQMAVFGRAENSALQVALLNPNDVDALNVLYFLAEKQNVSIEIYQTTQEILERIIILCSNPEGNVQDAISSFAKNSSGEVSLENVSQVSPDNDSQPETKELLPEQTALEGEVSLPTAQAAHLSPELAGAALIPDQSLQDTSVARLVQVLVEHALEARASDIHIEPIDKNYRVRFRVDGTLATALVLPIEIGRSVVSRIKILASLKIDERRKPQDGRFRVEYKARSVDLRVSTFPVVEGEKVVLRVLDTSKGMANLQDLGLEGRNHEVLTRKIKEPFGIILITGPTGSGKSTTLYAFLKLLNNQERNIVTLEDPVEYFLNGINQSQVKPEIGYTFANGLRSILRQDPNVIMVGEIRDEETAELSIHAALTGHLVFSTLHTNTAIGAVPRLIDMGIEPFLLSSSLQVVMAQRLVRRVCPDCKKEVTITKKLKETVEASIAEVLSEEFEKYGIEIDASGRPVLRFFQGAGCDKCRKTGYLGRVAVIEVLEVTPVIQEIIIDHRGNEAKIVEEAASQHMLSMRQDGILKALKGLTTLVEVEGVTEGNILNDLMEDEIPTSPAKPSLENLEEENNEDTNY
ncbi:MAG: GspE/PulE family protein [Candidatus Moraniibacteriota bacterium]